ncbi:hypothetical protein, partial [Accumulibacter sp.]|uniref:hypothetical protein n=1 Tax=Accumulibacter sp. TaxID=2053492 RepID=UPI0026343CC2
QRRGAHSTAFLNPVKHFVFLKQHQKSETPATLAHRKPFSNMPLCATGARQSGPAAKEDAL